MEYILVSVCLEHIDSFVFSFSLARDNPIYRNFNNTERLINQ